ncbi:PTS sugar transporter subunit IIA [Methylobacterium aerolatum]|uniref:PTS system nitrogen regulatory IIA component n=1 Tax=Methylobacterium aerolatum TaxID=418708 RepID=A0ABU0HUP7_9HYPH|nr:PTS sugar transporter subunit IIA [Methylobacterium aerolatum]MDQ0446011.1 PTS system nitrogen regulatory IIA component [Methylobacterium aerolatum]GJD35048.1 Nitrogen regulatory protein [Methylobacterium aerolatum]
MTVDEILAPEDALVGLRAASKMALLEAVAGRAADRLGLAAEAILAPVARREGLGSTGVGDGVALPHARLEGLDRPFGLLARLRDPVDFDAVDDRPVDLVFLLLLPVDGEARNLNALACVARWLRDPGTAASLRAARDAAALHAVVGGRA